MLSLRRIFPLLQSNMPASPIKKRKRGTRVRVCLDCGQQDVVRTDYPGIRCKRCTARIGGLAVGIIRRDGANRVQCSGCGVLFRRSASITGIENFCTPGCRERTRNIERRCKQCGASFRVYRSVVMGPTNAEGVFCSKSCYHAWLLAGSSVKPRYVQIKGKRRSAVINGRICFRCGSTENLQVHHVIPRRVGGIDEGNMIPLCRACHKIVECLTCDLIANNVASENLYAAILPDLRYAQC